MSNKLLKFISKVLVSTVLISSNLNVNVVNGMEAQQSQNDKDRQKFAEFLFSMKHAITRNDLQKLDIIGENLYDIEYFFHQIPNSGLKDKTLGLDNYCQRDFEPENMQDFKGFLALYFAYNKVTKQPLNKESYYFDKRENTLELANLSLGQGKKNPSIWDMCKADDKEWEYIKSCLIGNKISGRFKKSKKSKNKETKCPVCAALFDRLDYMHSIVREKPLSCYDKDGYEKLKNDIIKNTDIKMIMGKAFIEMMNQDGIKNISMYSKNANNTIRDWILKKHSPLTTDYNLNDEKACKTLEKIVAEITVLCKDYKLSKNKVDEITNGVFNWSTSVDDFSIEDLPDLTQDELKELTSEIENNDNKTLETDSDNDFNSSSEGNSIQENANNINIPPSFVNPPEDYGTNTHAEGRVDKVGIINLGKPGTWANNLKYYYSDLDTAKMKTRLERAVFKLTKDRTRFICANINNQGDQLNSKEEDENLHLKFYSALELFGNGEKKFDNLRPPAYFTGEKKNGQNYTHKISGLKDGCEELTDGTIFLTDVLFKDKRLITALDIGKKGKVKARFFVTSGHYSANKPCSWNELKLNNKGYYEFKIQ